MVFLSGQMARMYKLPWRVSGPKSGAKIADYCAGSDAAVRAFQSILSGANWISHCGGSLEGGMQLNLGKMLLDIELMSAMTVFARGVSLQDTDTALQMMKDVGEEGHFLGAEYTLKHPSFIPHLQDNETHDTWQEDGSQDGYQRGVKAARALLERYDEVAPKLDPDVQEALDDCMAHRLRLRLA